MDDDILAILRAPDEPATSLTLDITETVTCTTCRGTGTLQTVRRTIHPAHGFVRTTRCTICQGHGSLTHHLTLLSVDDVLRQIR